MTSVRSEILAAVRDVLRITLVSPVREGRPHPSAWPRGLREVGTASAAVFVLLALVILFAGPLRQYGDLAMSASTTNSLPTLTLPLLFTGVILSLTLAITAALHTSWWLRIALLVIGATATVLFTAQAFSNPIPLAISLVALLGLIGFTIVRSFRSYAWWEFPVVAAFLLVCMLVPWVQPMLGTSFGVDFRLTSLHGGLVSLSPLVLPAMMVAGSAPAQIVVTGAQATANRPVRTELFWIGFGVAVAWLAAATFLGAGGRELTGSALLASAVLLAVVGITVALLVRRARAAAPPVPEAYPEVWGRWLYPLATAVAAVVALTLPVIVSRGVAQVLGQSELVAAIDVAWNAFQDNDPATMWRGALGSVTLVIAWRLAAKDRLAEAVVLASFAILVLGDAIGAVTGLGFLRDRSTTALGLLATVVALAAAVLLALRRQLDRTRATGVMAVVLLAVLYPYRNVLDDPAGAILVVAPAVLLVFGLAWRVLTEAQVTYVGSPRYPQSTRVLLFLANTLFATTVVAYVTLIRGAGTDVDFAIYGVLGDTVLGDPLFVAGLVAGLWLVLRPPRATVPELSEPQGARAT